MVKKRRTHFSPFTRTQPVPTRTGILFRASRAIHLDFWGDSRNTFLDQAGFPRLFRGLLFFRPPVILSLNEGMEKSIRLHLLALTKSHDPPSKGIGPGLKGYWQLCILDPSFWILWTGETDYPPVLVITKQFVSGRSLKEGDDCLHHGHQLIVHALSRSW